MSEASWKRPLLPSTLVMNLVLYPGMVLWTAMSIILFPFAYVCMRMVRRQWSTGRITRHLIWIYGRVWIIIIHPFAPVRLDGAVFLSRSQPAILVSNHNSFLDIYCFGAFPCSDVAFAVRAWPFRMFWYAPFMRMAEYLNTEELGWDGCLDAGKKLFGETTSILFFPEGHRSKEGRLQRFYSGPFRLSAETGVPVVPICIVGTEVVLPPSRHLFRPFPIKVTALPPVDPTRFSGPNKHRDMQRYVKDVMLEHLRQNRHRTAA